MQFTFLGYSVKKIMELDLDVKDVTILRYFDNFRISGKMNYEIIEGVKYYWISYQNIENELPFLGLGKRAIMMRMLRLRDLGVLSHYTKKEGGTFSYYALGERYKELIFNKDNDSSSGGQAATSNDNNDVNNKEEAIQNNIQERDYLMNFEEANHKEEERVLEDNNRGYAEKCSTNNHLLNNSSTIVTNIYNNIKDKVINIINYLNSKVGVMYKVSNTKTINLVRARLKEGFTIEDFKTVIDKKVRSWKGTSFEQYLTPFTLFGDKFEVYLNQNILKENYGKSNNYYGNSKSYGRNNKISFDNFKGRDYDYADLERKLLGWDK